MKKPGKKLPEDLIIGGENKPKTAISEKRRKTLQKNQLKKQLEQISRMKEANVKQSKKKEG